MNAELEHYGVTDLLYPGASVLDCGASIGQFALPALEAGATVLAVEPRAENVVVLDAMARNKRHGDRLKVLHAAVGSLGGIVSLVEPDDLLARATGCYTTAPSDRDPLVARVPFDDLLTLRPSWDVVKVDIEGSEYFAFNASTECLDRVACYTIDTHRWTTGAEPRVDGVGHHERGAPYRPSWFDWLVRRLSMTHEVTPLGPYEPGTTLLAVRK